jgi:hypothetical protein
LIDLVHGAGFAEAARELRCGFGGGFRLVEECGRLAARNGAVEIPARLRGDPQGFLGRLQLGLLETIGSDRGTRRQSDK